MKENANSWKGIALISAAALTLCALPVTGFSAQPEKPRVIFPETSKAETGMTYGEWSVLWLQHMFLQPTASNPLLDKTGKSCAVGQAGNSPVFFMAGSDSSVPVTRHCTVPEGKKLFFPLVNAYDFHADPNDGLNTPANLWRDLYSLYETMSPKGPIKFVNLYARVDGVNVVKGDSAGSYACAGQDQPGGQVCASTFGVTLPSGNIFEESYKLAPGVYAPAVLEGYYLMLESLSVGSHTVEFGGSAVLADGSKFDQKITYNIFVKSNSTPIRSPKEKHRRRMP